MAYAANAIIQIKTCSSAKASYMIQYMCCIVSDTLQIPYPWPLSPVKLHTRHAKLNFTDLEFPEDDDDEDYNPEKDPEAAEELKDVSASVLYSRPSIDTIFTKHFLKLASLY